MSYLALYRKWRPQTFTDVVGQKQVSETLMRAIREDKVAHAYLFSGPRGTGKTSVAKIFARAINCEKGPTDHPCNECDNCKQILNGQSMDVVEIDAASNRGIDEIRALRESVKFMPAEGRKKIFIIDEAHMLTNEAWNALLKTIEEPPDHVLFIFATTEIDKLPVTILSRCQRYTFRRITAEDISAHLLKVAQASNISLDPQAAQLIAIHADGGLRDALSILDQCSGMTSDTITAATVENMIGLVSKEWIIQFFNYLRTGDGAQLLLAAKTALMEGRDSRQILEALIEHLRALVIQKVMPEAEELSLYKPFKEAFQAQADSCSVDELNYYVKELQQVLNDAKRVDNPRIVIEMGLLGICARVKVEPEDIVERVNAIERRLNSDGDSLAIRVTELEQGLADGRFSTGIPVNAGIDASAMQTGVARSLPGAGNMASGAVMQSVVPSGSIAPGTVPPGVASAGTMSPGMISPGAPLPAGAAGTMPPVQQAMPSPAGLSGSVGLRPPGSGAAPGRTTSANQGGAAKGNAAAGTNGKSRKKDLLSIPGNMSLMLGQRLVNPKQYMSIHKNMLEYLDKHEWNMAKSFYQMSALIYIDEHHAVFVFKADNLLKIAGTEDRLYEVEQAMAYALGYAVSIQIICHKSQLEAEYRNAARLATGGDAQTSGGGPTGGYTGGQNSGQMHEQPKSHAVPPTAKQPAGQVAPQPTGGHRAADSHRASPEQARQAEAVGNKPLTPHEIAKQAALASLAKRQGQVNTPQPQMATAVQNSNTGSTASSGGAQPVSTVSGDSHKPYGDVPEAESAQIIDDFGSSLIEAGLTPGGSDASIPLADDEFQDGEMMDAVPFSIDDVYGGISVSDSPADAKSSGQSQQRIQSSVTAPNRQESARRATTQNGSIRSASSNRVNDPNASQTKSDMAASTVINDASDDESTDEMLSIEQLRELPRWTPDTSTEEERNNPLLLGALTTMAAGDNDIYIENIPDDDDESTHQ